MFREYHVSIQGNDLADGSNTHPFRTITQAAKVAIAGDTVIVHEGTYREWVKPLHGGGSDLNRIVYKAAEGEKVIIKGSEVIDTWEQLEGTVWKATIPNTLFDGYNPYQQVIDGDWFLYPEDGSVHAGDVYLNGQSFYEAKSLSEVKHPVKRIDGYTMPISHRVEHLLNVDDSIFQWFSEVDHDTTTIYANFHGVDPNVELTEINVRKCCFYPEKTGLNYITVQGFEMAHAATVWAPPTGDQIGLLGTNWSKGWIIENNVIHDAKCSAVSIGKEGSTGDNLSFKHQQKTGYQYQLESVFKGLQIGWSKEKIGSHVVRGNVIYNCGQNGIVGHMGCAFSQIYNNHIYNIGIKHEYFGWEIAGIKFHAPIDASIHHNRVHRCTLGLWLDWQAQGARVSSNLFYENNRDCTIEVTHGPLIFDHNIFASSYNFDNHAQGTAFVNNLFCGKMCLVKIIDRATPYHFAHSTQIAGYAFVYNGDERLYNNIFVGGTDLMDPKHFFSGTAGYNHCTASDEDFHQQVLAKGIRNGDKALEVEQPAYVDGNVYLNGAERFDREKHFYSNETLNPHLQIIEDRANVYLEITVNQDTLNVMTRRHSTHTLGTVRIVEAIYDAPDGNAMVLDEDYFGNAQAQAPLPGPFALLKCGLNRFKVW